MRQRGPGTCGLCSILNTADNVQVHHDVTVTFYSAKILKTQFRQDFINNYMRPTFLYSY